MTRKSIDVRDEVETPTQQEPDEYHGQGGSYRINHTTGKRELVERTESPTPAMPAQDEPQEIE